MPKKVILDTDAGVDDALAILLAFRSPELEIEAVTTVTGNVGVEQVCKNVFRLFDVLSWKNPPPVARGADRCLRGGRAGAEQVHGSDGLGDLDELHDRGRKRYPDPQPRIVPLPAEDLLLELVKRSPGEITLITLGPLTNVAQALLKDPTALRGLGELLIMGGAVAVPGNVTPYAEFNLWADPEAAQLVLQAGLPTTLVGLDVTHQAVLSRREVKERSAIAPTAVSCFIRDCTRKYMDFHQRVDGLEGCYLHDPLAVGVAIDPSFVQKERIAVEVCTGTGPDRGQVKPSRSKPSMGGATEVDCCLRVDNERFLSFFLERLYCNE